ncbi:MAG: glycerol-3-phosphate acyltransferase [Acidimicrobiales bacterium]
MRAGRVIGAAALGYALGGFPSADLATVAARPGSGADLRKAGSGNPGAVNAMDVLGKGWGWAILVADIAKAALACTAGRALAGPNGAHVAGTSAVVGHCFPVANGFRGGKGVAASTGQCLATFPAYFPLDLTVALVAAKPRWRHQAFTGTVISSVLWVASGVLWWRRGWPNLWGPPPGPGLPVSAAATSALIWYRFLAARRTTPGDAWQRNLVPAESPQPSTA